MSDKTMVDEALANIFNKDEYAESATYRESNGTETTVAIFTGPVQEVMSYEGGQADVMAIYVRKVQIESPVRGDTVIIEGVPWRVGNVSGDGHVWTIGLSKDPRYAR